MSNKTIRILLKAVAALAITAASGSASFAGKFTVHQGERYRAILALRSMERLVDNPLIAQKFRDLGFAGVTGRARIPAQTCLRRSWRWLNYNNVFTGKLEQLAGELE